MSTTFFLVRAVVASDLHDQFDYWYANDHLPWAVKVFKCEKAWRAWSEVEQGVHYAVYRFADKAACDKALASDDLKALIADFDKSWPAGVTRTRDVVTLADERSA